MCCAHVDLDVALPGKRRPDDSPPLSDLPSQLNPVDLLLLHALPAKVLTERKHAVFALDGNILCLLLQLGPLFPSHLSLAPLSPIVIVHGRTRTPPEDEVRVVEPRQVRLCRLGQTGYQGRLEQLAERAWCRGRRERTLLVVRTLKSERSEEHQIAY